ncbi:MAG: ABC transporter substrate-binding protein [Anaerolinea sp.]|nr:ABC transporter substrate-binding protein [Anaerolinea sp.]
MLKKKLMFVVALLIVASMLLAACQPKVETPVVEEPVVEAPVVEAPVVEAPAPTEVPPEPTAVPTTRKGGWLDEIVFSVVDSDSALTQLKAGAIDIYANGLSSKDLPAIKEAGVKYSTNNGLYYDMLYNPAVFADGRLNPFSNRKIREATNWLFDRNYINQEVYEGGGLAKWFTITTQGPDYVDLIDVARSLETKYAYNLDKAKEVITAEMEGMGAKLVDGKWNDKNDSPIVLTLIIRSDSDKTRIPIGEYVASQFEAVGFTVDRQLKTSGEASPIWIGSVPEEGQWHVYTAAWGASIIDRDEANAFQEMYLPSSQQGIPAWYSNVPDPEFQTLGDRLYAGDYKDLAERKEMMKRAMVLSLEDSLQVFLIDGKGFIPYQKNVVATADLAAGVETGQIGPYTLRFEGQEGGTMKWATQELFAEPWNPIGGSNWTFDHGAYGMTMGADLMYDPYTGLTWPLRMEKADVVVQEGSAVGKTLDWVNLSFAPEIKVPGDAWVDWDATTQTFVTADTKFPEGQTAKRKTVAYYPADLYETVKWHDGSNFSLADAIMSMIMTFDRAKPESAIYDEAAVPLFDSFMLTFKGWKIVSTDPLVVEIYSDALLTDAELLGSGIWPWWNLGEASWHTFAIANLAEAAGESAYTIDKAEPAGIEQTSYIGGPTLEILSAKLDAAAAESLIPYAPTMGAYLTAEEAAARYANLKAFYAEHNHFWMGTGPYVLDKVFLTEKTLTLKQNADYADLSDRWATFGVPMVAEVEVDGPGQVTIGQEATFDVFVTFNGEPYLDSNVKYVKVMLYDATGATVLVTEATLVEEGKYSVTLTAEDTGKLSAGSNKLEVAVVPSVVNQPTFAAVEFVTQ